MNDVEHFGGIKPPIIKGEFRTESTDISADHKKTTLNYRDKLEKKFPLPDNVSNDLDDIAKGFRDG